MVDLAQRRMVSSRAAFGHSVRQKQLGAMSVIASDDESEEAIEIVKGWEEAP